MMGRSIIKINVGGDLLKAYYTTVVSHHQYNTLIFVKYIIFGATLYNGAMLQTVYSSH